MRRQCKKCPWRKDVDPHDIPNGYCEIKHANLKNTIADPKQLDLRSLTAPTIRMMAWMACHESKPSSEIVCVGWLANQLGPGNNIALRLMAIRGAIDTKFKLVGEQHETFEETLPRRARR